MIRWVKFAAFVLLVAAPRAFAAVPQTMSYQGVLEESTGIPVPDGTYSLVFRIYDVPAGGSSLWTETQPGVQVVGGEFNVVLGSLTALDLPFDAQYWLGISINAEPELIPRVNLASAPYSLSVRGMPGVSQGRFFGQFTVPTSATYVDVVLTTITIPASGYLIVEADAEATFSGTTNQETIYYQIDEASGGGDDVNQGRGVGLSTPPNTGSYQCSAVAHRAYAKPAGTYTFRLKARRLGIGGLCFFWNPIITAMYFPVAYGTVTE
jgi:hypothetical protein